MYALISSISRKPLYNFAHAIACMCVYHSCIYFLVDTNNFRMSLTRGNWDTRKGGVGCKGYGKTTLQ